MAAVTLLLLLASSCTFGTPGRSYVLTNRCSTSIDAVWELVDERPTEVEVLGLGATGQRGTTVLPVSEDELVVHVWVRATGDAPSWNQHRLRDAELPEPEDGAADREIIVSGDLCPDGPPA